MTLAPEWGGGGRDYVSYALALEALARASSVVAVIVSVNTSLVAEPDRAVRHRRAEAGVAAAARERRVHRRVRAVGGTGRVGCGESADRRAPRRARLRDRRPEGLGGQRRGGRRRDGLRGDPAGHARPRHQRVPGPDGYAGHRARGHRRFARRARARLHGPRVAPTSASGPTRCSARRARVSASCCGRSTAAASRLRRRHSARGRRRSRRRCGTPRRIRRSASRSATTRRSSGCWRTWRPSSKRRAC